MNTKCRNADVVVFLHELIGAFLFFLFVTEHLNSYGPAY